MDLRERRVTFRGREIPTRPPNNLQRQPLLALAVLAGAPGKTLTMADLAEGMHRLGGLRRRPVAPDARDLRYKILRAFRKVFADTPDVRPEIERLIESVPGVGLRLNLPGSAHVVDNLP
ncbi:MAG: hypothetical protein QME96_10325 [Myxococcota bacterium]|nr:hypothetical protein [Myxococcota bacterium]